MAHYFHIHLAIDPSNITRLCVPVYTKFCWMYHITGILPVNPIPPNFYWVKSETSTFQCLVIVTRCNFPRLVISMLMTNSTHLTWAGIYDGLKKRYTPSVYIGPKSKMSYTTNISDISTKLTPLCSPPSPLSNKKKHHLPTTIITKDSSFGYAIYSSADAHCCTLHQLKNK